MVNKKKSADAKEQKKPTVHDIANMYMTVATNKEGTPEEATTLWQNGIVNTFGGHDQAKTALASELKKRGGLIYKDKLVKDGDFEVYAELLLSNPSSPSLQLQMLDFGLDDAYKPVIAKNGKSVKYDSKKAVEIAKSRTEKGVKALSGKLKGDFKLGEDESKALDAHLQATYLDVFGKNADVLARDENVMAHYRNAMVTEMTAEQEVAKKAYELLAPYMTQSYMSAQEAGKNAAPAAKKTAAKK